MKELEHTGDRGHVPNYLSDEHMVGVSPRNICSSPREMEVRC